MRIALLTLLLVMPVLSRAQGIVQFRNSATTRLTTNDLQGQTGYTSGVNAYRIGLYVAPSGTTDPLAFSLVVPTAINLTSEVDNNINGRFNGGLSFEIPNNLNETIAFQVRAWSLFAGLSYEDAIIYNGPETVYLGSSAIGSVRPGILSQPSAILFGTENGQVGGFELTPRIIPEPSTWALVVLGAGALWFATRARRRKSSRSPAPE